MGEETQGTSDNQPPLRPRPTYERPSFIAAVVGVVLAFLSLIATVYGVMPKPDPQASVGATAGPTSVFSRPGVASPEPSTPTRGRCTTSQGAPAGCDAGGAVLRIQGPCDSAGVALALGLNPEEIELLVDPRPLPDGCGVAPAQAALDAGARTADLLKFPAEIPSSWIGCVPDLVRFDLFVPCNRPHTVEPISTWLPVEDAATPDISCQQRLASYVGQQAGIESGLQSRFVKGNRANETVYRCFVVSSVSLIGSVRGLNGRPLPRA